LVPHCVSSPVSMGRFDNNSDSDSNLPSPDFAHDSSDSNRPRWKPQKHVHANTPNSLRWTSRTMLVCTFFIRTTSF
jgi:hypothetical protein